VTENKREVIRIT